jgi:hypothetical protein
MVKVHLRIGINSVMLHRNKAACRPATGGITVLFAPRAP